MNKSCKELRNKTINISLVRVLMNYRYHINYVKFLIIILFSIGYYMQFTTNGIDFFTKNLQN